MSGVLALMYLGPEFKGDAEAARRADTRERLVVVGNGMAGCRAVEEILERDASRYRITIFGAEPRVNYNRIMLSPVLAGEQSFEDIVLNDERWYADNGIELIAGDPVVEIDREQKLVRAGSGRERAYDRLIIAAGSNPILIPVPGCELPGVVTFRDLDVGRGIKVDDHMATSDPAIFAVGECVEHRGVCYGLVAPLFEMCRTLAEGLTKEPVPYTGSVTSTKLKVSGIDVFSAGDFSGSADSDDIVLRDASRGVYKRLVIEEGRLIGAVLYGDTSDGNWYFDLLKRGEDITPIRESLIFGQAFADGGGGADPIEAVAALSDTAEICGCNGVWKGTITYAIHEGATTLDAVRATTKASASCGSCTAQVE